MDERLLFEKKWFDYRMLTPEAANLVFLRQFIDAYREYSIMRRGNGFVNPLSYRKRKKKGEAKSTVVSVPVGEVSTSWPGWKTLVELRQWADSHCLRYEDFWPVAFRVLVARKIPSFSIHFCKNQKLLSQVLAELRARPMITLSSLGYFKPENYVGHELQNDYYWHIYRSILEKYTDGYKEKLKTAVDEGIISPAFFNDHLASRLGRN